jgi:hypothetical protein
MTALGNDDRRIASEYLLLSVGAGLDVVGAPFIFKKFKPFGREHMGVDVNYEHESGLLILLR